MEALCQFLRAHSFQAVDTDYHVVDGSVLFCLAVTLGTEEARAHEV